MFFGKRAANKVLDAAKGVGRFIDEQQLTLEERLKLITEMMKVMGPFVTVQRIIITIIMIHWILYAIQMFVAIWLENLGIVAGVKDDLIEYAKLEVIWMPTLAAIGFYFAGGVGVFKRKKN